MDAVRWRRTSGFSGGPHGFSIRHRDGAACGLALGAQLLGYACATRRHVPVLVRVVAGDRRFFWTRGALLVLPFTGVEIIAVGIAFVVYGRHAADGERISLEGTRLVVERETAGRLERSEFDRQWVRVEPKTGDRSLITLSAQGRVVQVGRFVRPELRAALALEIRMALRAA